MPEESEVPTEHLHEEVHHAAEHSAERWILGVAVSTALLAVIAAVASLLAGHAANEAMIAQIKASDQWAYYQAKGIKSSVVESRVSLLRGLGKDVAAADEESVKRYRDEQTEIKEKAEEFEKESSARLERHAVFARSVTAFQIAIAVAAIAVLSRRRWLWIASLVLGVGGLASLLQGVVF